MTTNKGYWLTCDDCKYRITDDLYREYPCKLSHKEIAEATTVDKLTGRTICNRKEIEMIENDERIIWKCKCGWSNSGSREICDKCKEPKQNYNNPDESEFSEDYADGIRKTTKLSENVSQLSIEIQKMEKQKAIRNFYNSLLNAVQQACGSTSWITEDTTVKELAESLASNSVRFIHNGANDEMTMPEFQRKMFE